MIHAGMMKKKSITMFCGALLALNLVGCRASQPVETTLPASQPEMTEPKQTASVSAEFAVERFLAQRPDAKSYTDRHSDYSAKIVITFGDRVTNFALLALETDIDAGGNLTVQNIQPLYTLDGVERDDLIVIETELPEILPDRAISYVDASGLTQYRYLAQSGEDNVPLLIPFEAA